MAQGSQQIGGASNAGKSLGIPFVPHHETADYVLTVTCQDQSGIVHAVSGFLVGERCNILESAQFSDRSAGTFFMRVAFESHQESSLASFRSAFETIASKFVMSWYIHDCKTKARVLIMVSRSGHCLNDLLFRHATGDLKIEIPAIVSNHPDFERLAASYEIPFHFMPVSNENRVQQERAIMDLVERERIDLVVLARYMQVLSDTMCRGLQHRAINIHHSFLPGFKGARPYHQAHSRGVKLIGATAHYVTPDLDEGPIIEQDVQRVDHGLTPEDLVAIGRDIEARVLARAVRCHVERKLLPNGSRTVVFR